MNAILQSLLGVPPFVQDLSNKALLEKTHPQCLYRLVGLLNGFQSLSIERNNYACLFWVCFKLRLCKRAMRQACACSKFLPNFFFVIFWQSHHLCEGGYMYIP